MTELGMIRSLWWLMGDARRKWIDVQERTARTRVAERRDKRRKQLEALNLSESYIARKMAAYDRILDN